jgi:hypothetical protein
MSEPFKFRKKIHPEDEHTQEDIDAAYDEMRQEAEYEEMIENEINELRDECDWVDE